MPNKKINELSPRTPSLTDLIIVGDPSTGYSYKATISVLTAFAGSNIQFSSLGGISLTSPANGQVLQFNGTSWVNYTPTTWNTAYDRSLVSAAVSGSTTKTLTLTKQDGSTLTATWSDLNTDAVTSVFGRTGAVVATEGDYSLDLLSDVTLSTPTTNQVLQYNGTAWVNATFVAGINSLNGLTATTQTFATGTSGTDFGISSTTSTHTFNLPTASATNRGALSSADWTTFNSKVGGSGTTNYLSKWTSSTALGNSLVFDNGTNVGIGTTSPSMKLDVNGDIKSSGALQVLGTFASLPTGSGGFELEYNTGIAYITAYNRNSSSWVPINLRSSQSTFSTSGSERMRLTSAGRLLIGTTTESTFALDVSGTARVTGNATIGGFLFSTNGSFSIGIQSNVPAGVGSLQDVVFIGRNTGEQNTGWRNTALGSVSFRYNRTGEDNVAIGHAAVSNGGFNVRRDFNTGVGSYSLYLSDGNYNSAFGFRAGYGITTGIYNTIIGAQDNAHTGNGITTGSYNTIIGSGITGLSASLSNTIILADGQGNQRLYINNSGNVGIGTTSPTYKLDVSGTTRIVNGNSSITLDDSQSYGLILRGYFAIRDNGNANQLFMSAGALSAPNGINLAGTFVGNGITQYSGPLAFVTGVSGGTERMRLTNAGRLLIGTTTESTYLLDVNGTANISGATRIFDANLTMQKGAATGDQRISFRYGGTEYGYVGVNTSSGVAFFGSDTYGVSINTASAISCNGTLRVQSATVSGISPGFQIRNGGNIYFENYVDWGAVAGIIQTPSNYDLRLRTGTNNGILIAKTSGNVTIDANTFLAITSGSVGIGTTSPNASALLDVSSTTKGFLPPRMTGAQAEAIATPAAGLMVYANNGNGTTITSTGWWGYNGTTWVKLN